MKKTTEILSTKFWDYLIFFSMLKFYFLYLNFFIFKKWFE